MSEGEKKLVEFVEYLWVRGISIPAFTMDIDKIVEFRSFQGYKKIGKKHYWECDFGMIELKEL